MRATLGGWPLPIRARLLLFALLCAAPLVTLEVVQGADAERRVHEDADRAARQAAADLRDRLQRILSGAASVAHGISGYDLREPRDVAACSAALARALATSGPPFLNFAVLDLQGRSVCNARGTGAGVSFADRPYFQQALRERRPVLSGYTFGRVTRTHALQLAVPLLDGAGQVSSITVVAIDLAQLAGEHMPRDGLPDIAVVLDLEGTVVSRSPPHPAVPLGLRAAGTPLWRELQQGHAGSVVPALDGVLRRFAFETVAFAGRPVLRIAVGVDAAALGAHAAAQRRRQLALAGLVLAAALVVALAATRPVVLGRTRGLRRAARRVSEGNYGERLPVGVRDELSPVEEAFNAMLEAVEEERRQLRAREHRYRMLFELSLDAVLHTTLDGRVLAANPAACRLLGGTEAQLQQLRREDLVDAADPRLATLLAERAARGAVRGELRLRALDGRLIETAISSAVYQDANTGGQRAYIMFHDITAEREARAQIERLNAELEARVARRTRQLEALNRELEAFSYSVSHDLRSPVGIVRSFAGLLRERGLGGEREQHYLRRIEAAGAHMNELIEGMLVLSQVSRSPLAWDAVDLGALAEDVVAELRDAHPARAVDVRIAPGLACHGDARLLRMLLVNLLGNAWKFTAHAVQPFIALEGSRAGGETVFRVRDNGAGFEPSQARTLFQPFRRLHKDAEFPGIGIGLATAHRIVERHGGRIWADSTVGGGATFCFTLGEAPRAEQAAPAVEAVA